MADLRVYLDDERTPPDSGFTKHDGLVLIRSYGEFRKFLFELSKKRGEDKIVFISFDYQLGYDKDWTGYYTGLDCMNMMADMAFRFSKDEVTFLDDDIIVDAHSSDAEASGRILGRFRKFKQDQAAAITAS